MSGRRAGHRHAGAALYRHARRARRRSTRLCDPAAKVSAHYLIDEDGTVDRAGATKRARAWHAGVGWWARRARLNDVSIGIELVNPGHEWGYRAFPDAADGSAGRAGARHPRAAIRSRRAASSAIATSRPTRKEDPGELFDWRASAGGRASALWPAPSLPAPAGAWRGPAGAGRASAIQVAAAGRADAATAALAAFQRRLRPARCDGQPDARPWRLLRRRCSDGLVDGRRAGAYLDAAPDGRMAAPAARGRGRKVRAPREHGAG